jgi:hypothetical protein
MAPLDPCSQRAIGHIRHLSQAIGGRGSCTPAERQAAEYTAEQMRALGVDDVRLEAVPGRALHLPALRPRFRCGAAGHAGGVVRGNAADDGRRRRAQRVGSLGYAGQNRLCRQAFTWHLLQEIDRL